WRVTGSRVGSGVGSGDCASAVLAVPVTNTRAAPSLNKLARRIGYHSFPCSAAFSRACPLSVWCFNAGAIVALVPSISRSRDPAGVSGWLERQIVRSSGWDGAWRRTQCAFTRRDQTRSVVPEGALDLEPPPRAPRDQQRNSGEVAFNAVHNHKRRLVAGREVQHTESSANRWTERPPLSRVLIDLVCRSQPQLVELTVVGIGANEVWRFRRLARRRASFFHEAGRSRKKARRGALGHRYGFRLGRRGRHRRQERVEIRVGQVLRNPDIRDGDPRLRCGDRLLQRLELVGACAPARIL